MSDIPDTPDKFVPFENIEARLALWHSVWDWLIQDCSRRVLEAEAKEQSAAEGAEV